MQVTTKLSGKGGERALGQAQTYVPAETLQKLEQIPFEMAVVDALCMDMALERVFLMERSKAERRNLMEHDRNHRRLARTVNQMIVDTALSGTDMAAQLGQA
jgi:hypothetical protein